MEKHFSLAHYKGVFLDLVNKTDKKILAKWTIECVARVMPYFEEKYPKDSRPRQALQTLENWMNTGIFSMNAIRYTSLSSHAAARDVGEDNPARSVARAAGQAVATAHVSVHAIGGAIYALQAIYRATNSLEEVEKEKKWQYKRLLELQKN